MGKVKKPLDCRRWKGLRRAKNAATLDFITTRCQQESMAGRWRIEALIIISRVASATPDLPRIEHHVVLHMIHEHAAK